MEKFNDNLKQFVSIIKTNYPGQQAKIDEYYNFDSVNDRYLNEFVEICKTIGNDISTKNEIIFSKGSVVLKNIDFYLIWNDENLSDDQRENIWKYLQTLYIFAYEHIRESDFKSIMKEFKKLGSDRSTLDEETKTFIDIIESLTDKYQKGDNSIEEEDDDKENDGGFTAPDLFGGVIGDLAKEIVNEIDPSEINIENPTEILNNLLSGNFDENNDTSGIANLVKNITGKIQDKITSGDINEADLFGEAQNMMKNFSKGSKMKGMGNMGEMFSNMMKAGMASGLDGEAADIFKEASNIIDKGMPTNVTPAQLQSKAKLKSTRDRLRKKLEEKKKILESKQKENEIESSQNNIDLDALAREIEEIGENKNKNKKPKKNN